MLSQRQVRRDWSVMLTPVVSALLAALITPVIAWNLSQEDVGRFNLAQLYIALGVTICSLGLDQALTRYYFEATSRRALLKRCVVGVGFAVAVIGTPVALDLAEVSRATVGVEDSKLGLMMMVSVVLALGLRMQTVVLRMEKNGAGFMASQTVPKLILLAIMFVYVSLGRDLSPLGAVIATAVGAGVTAAMLLPLVVRFPDDRAGPTASLTELIGFGWPLALSALGFWGLQSIGALSLYLVSDLEDVGRYALTVAFAAPATIVQSILSALWGPAVYGWVAQGRAEVEVAAIRAWTGRVIVVLYLGIGSMLWVVPFAVPKGYIGIQYLVAGAIVPSFLYSMSEVTGVGLGIAKRSRVMLAATAIALAAGMVMAFPLVLWLGVRGAIIATILAHVVLLVARTEFADRVWMEQTRRDLYFGVALLVGLSVFTVLLGGRFDRLVVVAWPVLLVLSIYGLRRHLTPAVVRARLHSLVN